MTITKISAERGLASGAAICDRNTIFDVTVSRQGRNISRPQPHASENRKHRLLHIVDDDQTTGLGGYYIRLPDRAYDAYGDLVSGCDSHGVVLLGNKMTFVASDGVSAQFQYEIRLDEIVTTEVDGMLRAEGVIGLDLDRPPQEMFYGMYFPIPSSLERFLVPRGEEEIRLNLHCEWIETRTGRLWEVETSTM